MQKSSLKFDSLDTLRGVAALFIFVYHFHTTFTQTYIPKALALTGEAGHVGLDVFFVLSGFLIFRSLYLHGVNKRYFIRRLLRIAPIYYFSLLVVLLFIDQSYFFSLSGLYNIFSHLFFLQSFSSATYHGINPVLWSLSVELIFYLFLPIMFIICRKKNKWIILGILLMIATCYFYRFGIMAYYGQWDATQRMIYTENFIGRLDQFAFGMLASLITIKIGAAKFLPKLSLLLITIGCGGIIWGMMCFEKYQSGFRDILMLQVFLHSAIGLSAAFLIFGLSNTYKIISKVIGNKIFAFVGIISYSFYIWHPIIIEQIKKLSEQINLFGNEFLISFLVTLSFSTITYYFIERIFLAKKKYNPIPSGELSSIIN